MPDMIEFGEGIYRPVATEQELLDFVNRGREAGGANVLEALLPSVPQDHNSCLIANGLNFSCSVYGNIVAASGWAMYLPQNMPYEQARAVADALECPLWSRASGIWEEATSSTWPQARATCIPLPEHIGSAAAAFDEGVAFQNYVKEDTDA
jgi:hypothetical protein